MAANSKRCLLLGFRHTYVYFTLTFYTSFVLTNDSNMQKINMADTVSSATFHNTVVSVHFSTLALDFVPFCWSQNLSFLKNVKAE
jgi:hypothetical protein